MASDDPEPIDPPPSADGAPARLARPRLADLFVMTAALSLFLGLCRYSFESDLNFAIWPVNPVETLGYALGVACCWTGIFRMARPGAGGGPLPRELWQPGEMICVVEGGYYLVVAVMGAWLRIVLLDGAESVSDETVYFSTATVAGLYLLPALAMSAGYAWMARRVDVPRWRRAAVAKVIGHVGGPALILLQTSDVLVDSFPDAISVLLLLSLLAPTLLVVLAAWGDRKLPGVHWTHWLGLAAFALIYVSRVSLELRVWLGPVE